MIFSFCSDVIFVIPVRHTFQSYPHRFVGIDITSIFGLAFPNIAAGFSAAICCVSQSIAAGIGNSNFLRAFFHGVFKFFIIRFNEEDTTSLSCIIELWFLDCPLLLCLAFRCIRHMLPQIWPYIVGS